MILPNRTLARWVTVTGVAWMGVSGCDSPAPVGADDPDPLLSCSLDQTFLASGGVTRDAIPALSDPPLVTAFDQAATSYLAGDDRVVGFLLDGEPVAVPHNVLWHHEIVNLDGSPAMAVTYCPLTGSALVFDRSVLGGAEFRVSGLLYQSNLIMFDRDTDSLWPQMLGEARCGPRDGTTIPRVPAWEMTWASWRAANPLTRVVSGETGWEDDYSADTYPYGDYEVASSEYWFAMPDLDPRRAPKERVLGIPAAGGAPSVAFPFKELDRLGSVAVVEGGVPGRDLVVLWDREGAGATAFTPVVDGVRVTLEARPIGDRGAFGIFDQNGTQYGMDGEIKAGPQRGARLTPVPDAYVAFWGAWAAFHPTTRVWDGS